MGLKLTECAIILCFCAVGIQYTSAFLSSMREIEQNCARDGGFCINVNVPQPRRRAQAAQRRQPGFGAGAGAGPGAGAGARRGTRTRKGSRPDPRALGQQHTRLPGSAKPSVPGAAPAAGAAPPAYAPAAPAAAPAAPQNTGFLFGGSSSDPFGGLMSMMMFSRKKRQAPAILDPAEIAEIPRRRKNQSMYSYLNVHCRKSEFDFGCRKTGGFCCIPFPR